MDIGLISPPSPFDYASWIAEVFNNSLDEPPHLSRYQPHREEFAEVSKLDGAILTGSTAHIYNRKPWMKQLESHIWEFLQADLPVLGVCFGHQFLADILGGRVQPLCQKAAGYADIQLTHKGVESSLFTGFTQTLTAFEWHNDIVVGLPSRTKVLAQNESGIQSFASQRVPAWGIQFHPECGMQAVDKILGHLDDPQVRAAVLETYTDRNIARSDHASSIYTNFIKRVVP